MMTDSEVLAAINAAERDATIHNGEFMGVNERLLSRYLGLAQGDEIEGQSSVISMDVQDVIEADMPSLARIFLGNQDILQFKAQGTNPAAIAEAKEKTAYVNYLIKNQPGAYKKLHDWIKDALIQKMGVVKFRYNEEEKIKVLKYKGLSTEELAILVEDLESDRDVDSVEIVGYDDDDDEIEIKLTMTCKSFETIPVPVESFLISRNAASKDEAEFVGEFGRISRGELIAMGYDEDDVRGLPSVSSGDLDENSSMKQIRFLQQGGEKDESSFTHWTSQLVAYSDTYPLLDYDGDGIAERRHIFKAGNKILTNEPFEIVPYAILSAILMPHSAIGRSRAEVAEQTQVIKTAISRQINDNIYRVNNARVVVNDDDTNIDDLLTVRPNGIVRTNSADPRMAVAMLETPYIGDKALQVLQYWDNARSQSTGSLMASQGLEADTLYRETATRFQGVQDASFAKVELVARCMAETGFKELYDGYAWMVSHYQSDKDEIMVLGKPVTVDPRKWRHEHRLASNVGLAAGDDTTIVQNMAGLLTIHNQLKLNQSVLTDEKKVYNTVARMVQGMGLIDTHEFFNDPGNPDDTIAAQNEILMNAVESLQAQVQGLQNPLAEAAMVEREGRLAIAQAELELKSQKQSDDHDKWQAEMKIKATEIATDTAIRVTELELANEQELTGEVLSANARWE
jgi:hypothetical protein